MFAQWSTVVAIIGGQCLWLLLSSSPTNWLQRHTIHSRKRHSSIVYICTSLYSGQGKALPSVTWCQVLSLPFRLLLQKRFPLDGTRVPSSKACDQSSYPCWSLVDKNAFHNRSNVLSSYRCLSRLCAHESSPIYFGRRFHGIWDRNSYKIASSVRRPS